MIMNRKKKVKSLSIENASSKKHKVLTQKNKQKTKVTKSKLKTANNAVKNKVDSSKSKTNNKNKSKTIINKSKVKDNKKKNVKAKKEENTQNVVNKKVQNASTLSTSLSPKKSKGRPRIKSNVTTTHRRRQQNQSKTPKLPNKTTESHKAKQSNKISNKIIKIDKIKESLKGKETKPNKTKSITNGETSSNSVADLLPSTSTNKVRPKSIKNKKTVKTTNKNMSSKRSNQISNNRKRVTSTKSGLQRKRKHRVASLNASAKVRVLCESDRDSSNVNKLQHRDSLPQSTVTKPQSKSLESYSNSAKPKPKSKLTNSIEKTPKKVITKTKKSTSKKKITNKQPKVVGKKKISKKKVKRKLNLVDKDVEIIDTRRCKRMASLNASAMMAATYLPETRIVKRNSFVDAQPHIYIDPISSVSETIEQVVSDHWSSTVEQHIEYKQGSSGNLNNEQKCKTTLKTTVKHVKLRGTNTVVETISTEFHQQQQNIVPEVIDGKKTGKSQTSKQTRTKFSEQVSVPQLPSNTSGSSAFTPCSGNNTLLNANSIGSIALISASQPTAFSSSLSVQNYQTKSIASGSTQSKKRVKSGKKDKYSTSNKNDDTARNKSNSIIRKYEVKTIETRMESSNQSNGQNPILTSGAMFGTASTSSLTNLINPNNLSRSNPSMMIYPHPTPLHSLSSAASLSNQSVRSENASYMPESSTSLNLNVTPFNTQILQYQPIPSAFAAFNPSSFSSPIPVPFFLSNPSQQFSPNPYGLINQRANLPVSMFGIPYLNSQATAGMYQPSNPVINILPSTAGPSPSSGCALIHRPIAYHPQSGQVSAATNTNMPSLVNNSVFATSPFYGHFASTPSNNLFQCSMIRSPAVASVRPLTVPVGSYSQPNVLVPPTVNNCNDSSVSITSIHPPCNMQSNSNVSLPQSMSATVSKQNNTSVISQTVMTTVPISTPKNLAKLTSESNYTIANDDDPNSHIQQLANMTNSIVSNHNERQTPSISKSFPVKSFEESSNGRPSNTSKKISIPGTAINKKNHIKTNGKSKNKFDSNTLTKSKVIQNGLSNRNLNNGIKERNERKKSKVPKVGTLRGVKSTSPVNTNKSSINNVSVHESNGTNKEISQEEENGSDSPLVVDESESNSLISNNRLLPGSHSNLKKNKHRPIVHGWSWEGDPSERYIFMNNDDQPCLRKCYPAIKHAEGETIRVRDCVLLKSGPRKTDLPFVAKITALWESLENGMMMSLLWYYRPEHTDIAESYISGEIYASRHRDTNSVACIDDKCYVLTYNEFCRYKRHKMRLLQHYSVRCDKTARLVPKSPDYIYARRDRIPPLNVLPELVFCCRKVFDFRQKRILKNPNFRMDL